MKEVVEDVDREIALKDFTVATTKRRAKLPRLQKRRLMCPRKLEC